MAVYKPNVPLSTDFISQSQIDFNGNFDAVHSIWGKPLSRDYNVGDHIPLTNAKEDDLGKHRKMTLVKQDPIPSPGVSELDLYSASDGTKTELYYRRNGDATGNKITHRSKLIQGGLVLEAYVMFDVAGNIIERTVEMEDGEDEKIPISYNIRSVVNNLAPISGNYAADFTVTFDNAISTADFFWDIQAFNSVPFGEAIGLESGANIQPKNDALYSNTITANSINIFGYKLSGSLPNFGDVKRIYLEVYTAA